MRVLMHSLAFGTLLPVIGETAKETLSQKQMEMTVDVMANSLIYWAQDLVAHDLLRKGSRIFAMTSSGSTRVIKSYGAVSAAKAALEAHIRQLAFELAPLGVTANAIRAGVTDTPALRRIPEGVNLLERVKDEQPQRPRHDAGGRRHHDRRPLRRAPALDDRQRHRRRRRRRDHRLADQSRDRGRLNRHRSVIARSGRDEAILRRPVVIGTANPPSVIPTYEESRRGHERHGEAPANLFPGICYLLYSPQPCGGVNC